MTKKLIIITYFLLFISSCSKPTISIYYKWKEIQNNDYGMITIKASNKNLQIDSDSAICKWLTASFKISNELDSSIKVINTTIWLPQDTIQSKNKLCLLIPPALANTAIMYPIAVKLIKKNVPVVFLSYHGVKNDLMEDYDIDYGIKEIYDGVLILREIPKLLNYDTSVIVIYGVSLGGIVALNIAANSPNVKAIVLEAMPYNVDKASKRVLGKSISELKMRIDIKNIEDYQPKSSIKKIDNQTHILALWSLRDKYIDKDDIDSLIHLFNKNMKKFDYHLINKEIHHLRYVYPLSKTEYDSLNNIIVDFIHKNLFN